MEKSLKVDEKTLPKTFVLELTQRCNNRCLYCYTVWGNPELGYDQYCKGEMSVGEIKEIITKLQNEIPIENIALSGGEPLLRKDLHEILSFLKNREINTVIITNGTLLTKERVAETMIGGNYEVTLLSYQREVHDRLAGRPGAWDETIDGLTNIRQAGGGFIAVFVATKLNYNDFFKTAELAIALGAYGLMYNRMNLGAYNMKYAEKLLPTVDMVHENLEMLEEIEKKYELPTVVSVVIEPCVVNLDKYKKINFGWCPLGGENSYFTIDPIGNIRICNHSPVVLGNLKNDSFIDIFNNHPHVKRFRDTLPKECINCDPLLKDMCKGGCKAAGEQCYGSLTRVDPFVTLNRKPDLLS
ncbi:MAG: radical SAM protein [Anaerolineales bacterium]|jgi:radical SAM protein with 4Fe4S-binding SPASM domain